MVTGEPPQPAAQRPFGTELCKALVLLGPRIAARILIRTSGGGVLAFRIKTHMCTFGNGEWYGVIRYGPGVVYIVSCRDAPAETKDAYWVY